MCYYSETLEENSLSIGTHLFNDFYDKSNKQFDKSILGIDQKNSTLVTTELLALNFEMRSKKFIEEVNLHQSLKDKTE